MLRPVNVENLLKIGARIVQRLSSERAIKDAAQFSGNQLEQGIVCFFNVANKSFPSTKAFRRAAKLTLRQVELKHNTRIPPTNVLAGLLLWHGQLLAMPEHIAK